VVITGFEIIENVFNLTVSVNQEADAMDPIIGFPHKGFLAPDAKLLADLMILVGQQGKVKQLFFGKTGKLFRLVSADSISSGFCRINLSPNISSHLSSLVKLSISVTKKVISKS